jgi:hypothetical protein
MRAACSLVALAAVVAAEVLPIPQDQCTARCGSQVGFIDERGPDLFISYDGTTLDVPQQCRAERCGVIEAELAQLRAAQQTATAAQAAESAAIRELLDALSKKHDLELQDALDKQQMAEEALKAAIAALDQQVNPPPTPLPTPAPTVAPTPAPTPACIVDGLGNEFCPDPANQRPGLALDLAGTPANGVWKDRSGNGNDCTLVGATKPMMDTNGGIHVQGSSTVNAGCTMAYDKSIDSGRLRSWEFVLKLESYGGSNNGRFWEVRRDEGGEWNICPGSSNGEMRLHNSAASSGYSNKGELNLNEYVHVVITFDPDTGTITNYRNGASFGSTKIAAAPLFEDEKSVRALMGAANGRPTDRSVRAEVRSIRAYTGIIDQPTALKYAKEAIPSMFVKDPTHLLYKDGYDIFYVSGVTTGSPSAMYDACESHGGRSVGNYVKDGGAITDKCGHQVVVLSTLKGFHNSPWAYGTDFDNSPHPCNEVVYCDPFVKNIGGAFATIGNYGIRGSCSSGHGPFIGSHGMSWKGSISGANVICARTPGCTSKSCIDWGNTGPISGYTWMDTDPSDIVSSTINDAS